MTHWFQCGYMKWIRRPIVEIPTLFPFFIRLIKNTCPFANIIDFPLSTFETITKNNVRSDRFCNLIRILSKCHAVISINIELNFHLTVGPFYSVFFFLFFHSFFVFFRSIHCRTLDWCRKIDSSIYIVKWATICWYRCILKKKTLPNGYPIIII